MTQMKDVAKQAGVSPSTVSRVLTGSAMVSEENRRRVNEAIAELGYRPNRVASHLRRQKTHKIGVIVPDIENPTFSEAIRVIEDVAYREGYRVLLCNSEDQPEKQQAYLETLVDERVDGIILVPFISDGSDVSAVIDRGIPLVAFDRPVADPRADAVIADDFDTGRRATEFLIEKGHKAIAFVSGIAELKPGADRLAGYETSMRNHGLIPHVVSGGFKIEGGRAAMVALLESDREMSAVIIANNMMTIGALQAIRERKTRVPDELSMIVINDPWWTELVVPPLTAFALPVRRMAEAAVDLLFDRIDGTRTQTKCVVYGGELRIRESVLNRA
jgi:DNA-binding LacI/PurR family transcriptional regulator